MESKDGMELDFDNNFDFEEFMNKYMDDNYGDVSFEEMSILEELYMKLYLPTAGTQSQSQSEGEGEGRSNKKLDVEIEICNACLIEINPFRLIHEAKHFLSYVAMIQFVVDCRLKSILQMFDHPGDSPIIEGDLYCGVGVTRAEPQSLTDEPYCSLAIIAINEYNKHTKEAKLKLVQLEKFNSTLSFSCTGYYMTFTAMEEETTGHMGRYQAALAQCSEEHYYLGFFRHVDADKVLAILSIKGTEEEVEAKLAKEAENAKLRKELFHCKAAETPLELQKPANDRTQNLDRGFGELCGR